MYHTGGTLVQGWNIIWTAEEVEHSVDEVLTRGVLQTDWRRVLLQTGNRPAVCITGNRRRKKERTWRTTGHRGANCFTLHSNSRRPSVCLSVRVCYIFDRCEHGYYCSFTTSLSARWHGICDNAHCALRVTRDARYLYVGLSVTADSWVQSPLTAGLLETSSSSLV